MHSSTHLINAIYVKTEFTYRGDKTKDTHNFTNPFQWFIKSVDLKLLVYKAEEGE